MKKKSNSTDNGFSLLEVMIALTIFAIFSVAFVTIQGNNLATSSMLQEETTLKELCEQKINEVIANPPELKESLTLTPEKKDFESNKNYSYEVLYKKLTIPDFSKITGDEDEDQQGAQAFDKVIFENMKNNIEKFIWQIKVTAINKETGFSFSLSTWLLSNKAKVEFKMSSP